jgi:hypothetical protein
MIDQSLAMAPGQGHWGNCNSTGALGQQQQNRVATATATAMAIAMAMAIVFRSCCNGDGATAIDRSIAITMGLGQGHWGTGARATATAIAMAMGQRSIDRAIVLFQDQCHVLWLLKTCKTCGRALFVKLFLRLKHAPFDLKF